MSSSAEEITKIVHQMRHEDPAIAVFLSMVPNEIDRYLLIFSCALYRMGQEAAWAAIEEMGQPVSELARKILEG